ncbi:hypothetical protein GCM10017559_65720 [Streptosporangium longisporum]|uniref:Uncharacterized protein n=1 Tax=Streptosporangium longisporum TaxID=46187 RepID=A0ABP6L1L1_9ACTN
MPAKTHERKVNGARRRPIPPAPADPTGPAGLLGRGAGPTADRGKRFAGKGRNLVAVALCSQKK